MNIQKATQRYETWLERHLRLIREDLDLKHREMRSLPFPFLRATYYRWAQTFPEVCGDLARAPKALAVGDLHVENFGTWRDVEGRLIWGINDFDEAWMLPYTHDLVRLATSALLAKMDCDPKAGIGAILKGYAEAVTAGGRPFALAEHHTALRHMATSRLHDVQAYWQKLFGLGELKKKPPAGAIKAIERMMPGRRLEWRISHRVAGLGTGLELLPVDAKPPVGRGFGAEVLLVVREHGACRARCGAGEEMGRDPHPQFLGVAGSLSGRPVDVDRAPGVREGAADKAEDHRQAQVPGPLRAGRGASHSGPDR